MARAIRQTRQETSAEKQVAMDRLRLENKREDYADAFTGSVLMAWVPQSRCGRFVHELSWCRPTWCWNGDSQFRRRANFMRRRSFLCLCFRIFFRRFFTTLAIHTPSFLPQAETGNCTTVRVSLTVESHVIKTVIKNAEVTQRPKKCQEKARVTCGDSVVLTVDTKRHILSSM